MADLVPIISEGFLGNAKLEPLIIAKNHGIQEYIYNGCPRGCFGRPVVSYCHH